MANALEIIDITATNIYANTRMSQFVIHGVPRMAGSETTPAEMNQITEEIRSFTSFNLTVPPKWLAHPEVIRNQANGSIIVSFPGNVEMLGIRYMTLFNWSCRVEKARPDHHLTRCRRCHKIGHHQDRCEAPPQCGVCADNHMTEDHKCSSKACSGGVKCTHTPLRCVNCPAIAKILASRQANRAKTALA